MADLVAAYIHPNPHTTENSGISGKAGSPAMTITAAVQTSILNPPETSAVRRLGVVSASSAMAALQQIPSPGASPTVDRYYPEPARHQKAEGEEQARDSAGPANDAHTGRIDAEAAEVHERRREGRH